MRQKTLAQSLPLLRRRLIAPLITLTLAVAIWTHSIPNSFAQNTGEEPIVLVVLGDSLTAGYGLANPEQDSFPAQLQSVLVEKGWSVEVRNAGVSGDTSTGGLARLDWSVAPDTDAVIVELGANDALRGINPSVPREALNGIVNRLKEREIDVLLTGMLAPPNLGPDYGQEFNTIYPDLAQTYDVLLYPFFLDGVAAEAHLNQPDGIHPTVEGVSVIVERIVPLVEELLARSASGS